MKQISVGKNVVRILGHEFPVDSDLSMVDWGQNKAWRVNSIRRNHLFTPVVDNTISPETFRMYNTALHQSKAFNSRGKLRQLFDKKEEGVKVIPGHGVFILPSKMVAIQRGPRKVIIRVFSGTELSKEFHNPDYKSMVLEAANYYFDNLRFITDEVNKNLWYPVKYNRNHQLIVEDLVVPDGVQIVCHDNGNVSVKYWSIDQNTTVHVGVAKTNEQLSTMFEFADDARRKEQKRAAMYRFVNPSYVPLSLYMRRM